MSSFRSLFWLLPGLVLWSTCAQAGAGYVLGLSGEVDTNDGRSLTGFVDYGLTDDTWISVALGSTDSGQESGVDSVEFDTVYADAGFEHFFGLVGIRLGAAYWGDDEILDSADIRSSIFLRGKTGSLSLNYERRDFDFVFRTLLDRDTPITAEFQADGVGAAASISTGERTRLFVSGMSYDYSRDLRLQPSIDSLRFLSLSRLSLINSLIDYRVSGGIEIKFGQRSLDLTVGGWQTAFDGSTVNSFAVGFIVPAGPTSDIEYRLAYDTSDNFGNTISLALSFFYFGE